MLLYAVGAIAAILAAGYAVKVVITRKTSNKTDVKFTSQRNNSAGGDIIAGNSTKINKK